jgi:hypothetical protein
MLKLAHIMNENKKLGLALITPFFVLLAHYSAMLPHEYMHSFVAWLLGDKSNPLALTYGGTSWSNLLLLTHMDENVNYDLIISMGHRAHIALIAFSGAGFANAPLFILSLWLLSKEKIKNMPYLYYFIFLFNLMNLGNFYDYVPIRTFSTYDDVANFIHGLNISPWWVYIIGGYIVAFLIWRFFTRTLISAFIDLSLTTASNAALMIVCVIILFGYYGSPGLLNHGEISFFLSVTSVIAIPGLIIGLWPTRNWVVSRLNRRASLNRNHTT